MKQLLRVICLAGAALSAGCSSDATNSAGADRGAAPAGPTATAAPRPPEAVAKDFLAWYQRDYEQLSTSLVPAADDADTANMYAVDFEAAGRYAQLLRASGFLSPAYLARERAYVRRADSLLRAHPQTQGPPDGLNYDRVVHSQDAGFDLRMLARTTPTRTLSPQGDTARVYFGQLADPDSLREGADLEFLLTRPARGLWLIDDIRPVFAE